MANSNKVVLILKHSFFTGTFVFSLSAMHKQKNVSYFDVSPMGGGGWGEGV